MERVRVLRMLVVRGLLRKGIKVVAVLSCMAQVVVAALVPQAEIQRVQYLEPMVAMVSHVIFPVWKLTTAVAAVVAI